MSVRPPHFVRPFLFLVILPTFGWGTVHLLMVKLQLHFKVKPFSIKAIEHIHLTNRHSLITKYLGNQFTISIYDNGDFINHWIQCHIISSNDLHKIKKGKVNDSVSNHHEAIIQHLFVSNLTLACVIIIVHDELSTFLILNQSSMPTKNCQILPFSLDSLDSKSMVQPT